MFGFRLKQSVYGPIGLDIGNSSLRMVQLRLEDQQSSVAEAQSVPVDFDINGDVKARHEFTIAAIKKMLSEGSFRGKKVVSCLPNDKVKITSVRLNKDEMVEPENALWREAKERFGVSPEKDTINYVTAGGIRQGTDIRYEVILFAVENEYLERHVELLEGAGLEPEAIDTVPCALFRSFEYCYRRQEDRDHTIVFIDIGSKFCTVVFTRQNELKLVKKISIGRARFLEEIASRLGISKKEAFRLRATILRQNKAGPDATSEIDEMTRRSVGDAIRAVAEELAREVSLCFKYYTVMFKGRKVRKAVLSGGESGDDIVLNAMRRQLGVEIELSQPFRGIEIGDSCKELSQSESLCQWAVAVGLGLKGWQNLVD